MTLSIFTQCVEQDKDAAGGIGFTSAGTRKSLARGSSRPSEWGLCASLQMAEYLPHQLEKFPVAVRYDERQRPVL